METFRSIVGHHTDDALHDALHELELEGRIVHLRVPTGELGRRRFKVLDRDGIEYGVALTQGERLRDGSVLAFSPERAVVIDAEAPESLGLRARTLEGGIQLGWHAGHLHWRVRMHEDVLTVLLDGPADDYLVRIQPWIDSGDIEAVP